MDTATTTITNLDFALNYALEWGWAVFPLHSIASDGFCTCGNSNCKSEAKHPLTKNGVLDATKDEGLINSWWQQWPDHRSGCPHRRRRW